MLGVSGLVDAINHARPAVNGVNPDLALFDVQRIEVLRGPKGTLYGAGAMSGAIRVITQQAKVDAREGALTPWCRPLWAAVSAQSRFVATDGAMIVAAPLKIRDGSGSPLRVLALVAE